jgi:hypothetical protein
MNPAQLELFRVCLLQQLRAAGDGSLAVAMLLAGAKLAGFDSADEPLVRATLAYLADKGFAAPVAKAISPENRRWRITAAGTDFLAESGQ